MVRSADAARETPAPGQALPGEGRRTHPARAGKRLASDGRAVQPPEGDQSRDLRRVRDRTVVADRDSPRSSAADRGSSRSSAVLPGSSQTRRVAAPDGRKHLEAGLGCRRRPPAAARDSPRTRPAVARTRAGEEPAVHQSRVVRRAAAPIQDCFPLASSSHRRGSARRAIRCESARHPWALAGRAAHRRPEELEPQQAQIRPKGPAAGRIRVHPTRAADRIRHLQEQPVARQAEEAPLRVPAVGQARTPVGSRRASAPHKKGSICWSAGSRRRIARTESSLALPEREHRRSCNREQARRERAAQRSFSSWTRAALPAKSRR